MSESETRADMPQAAPVKTIHQLEAEVHLLREGLKQAERIRLLHSRMAEQLKVANRERKRAEAHLVAILRAALNGIVEIDDTGAIVFANPAAHQIFGWPAGALVGQRIETLVSPLEQEALHIGLTRYFQTGESALIGQVVEVIGTRRDGTRVPCDLTLASVPSPDRRRYVLAVVQDISVRKREEAESIRLAGVETMRQLLEGITHGVKNPLFILTGRLQLLESKLTQPESVEFKADVGKIQAAVQRLTAALGQMDAFTAAHRSHPEPCRVAFTVEEAAAFLADHFAKDRIKLITRIASDLPEVLADPNQFRLMFLNLMLYAVEHMRANGKGTLTVSAQRSTVSTQPSEPVERWIEVRMQDDGPEISPEQVARLFEPFSAKPESRKGTGLELWTVRTTVMALKGTVTCESRPGQGATFIVRLPVATEPPLSLDPLPAGKTRPLDQDRLDQNRKDHP
ncbi:MAG: PAS domain S-box protein [Nitrospirae bacterium]|nr:MAG: PAS domain S-box protein [Nitrospirota bacterium]